jgi:lipopolysaccharide transport system ATP-binding protein
VSVPIGGLVISNERGVIVHGKNGWQFPEELPRNVPPGTWLHYRHEVGLDLAPGDYTFEVGLAAVDVATWDSREQISHDLMNATHERLCHLPRVGTFSIGLAQRTNGVPYLTHHGVADLPGRMRLSLADQDQGR